MDLPVQITFRNMDESQALVDKIKRHAERLERFFDSIIGCRVLVEAPHRHHQHGAAFRVAIELIVPKREIVVSRDRLRHGSHQDVYVAIRDAFNAARRQLQDYSRALRGQVKFHQEERGAALH